MPVERAVDEDNFFPEKYTLNCERCKTVIKNVCPSPSYSGLPCAPCEANGVPCVWPAPKSTTRNVNDARKLLEATRSGNPILKQKRNTKKSLAAKGETDSDDVDDDRPAKQSARASKQEVLDAEFRPGLRELGAGRHREEARPGPSRIDRDKDDKSKRNDFNFFNDDPLTRQSKRSRPEGDRSKRPDRDVKRDAHTQRRQHSPPPSSELSSLSSPEAQRRKPLKKEYRDEPTTSKRRTPPPTGASVPKPRDPDRALSGANIATVPGPLKKKRAVVESEDSDDEPRESPAESSRKRAAEDVGRKEKKPRVDDANETPRKRPKDDDERPTPRNGDRQDDSSIRKHSRHDDEGRPRPKQRLEREGDQSKPVHKDESPDHKKARRDETHHVERADRDEPDRSRKVKREDRENGGKSRRADGEAGEKVSRDGLDRPHKNRRAEGEDVDRSIQREARDEEKADPARKRRRLSDSEASPDGRPEEDSTRQKDKQHSALAQRALDPKRTKPDTPSQSGDATPVTRKPARPVSNTSGKNTPMGKNKAPVGDKVSELLSASLTGASSAYASMLGIKSHLPRDRYSGRIDRGQAKPAAPVVPVTRGTLDLMGTLKTISDFQVAAKRRYAHSYGLQPVGTAKSVQTTAFMKRFREQRAHGAYNNTLSTLCVPPSTRPPAGEQAVPNDVEIWLKEHGTAPLVPPRFSMAVVEITPAQPVESISGVPDPVKPAESGTMSDNPIAV